MVGVDHHNGPWQPGPGALSKGLNSPCRYFYLMIMEMVVPLNGGKLPGEVFGDEILDPDQGCFRIGRFEEQTLRILSEMPLQ